MKSINIKNQNTIRLAKKIAYYGYCSRREAEKLIQEQRVTVNGVKVNTPAFFVTPSDIIAIDKKVINKKHTPLLFGYYKPKGLVCSTLDEKNRPTIFDDIKEHYPNLPRLMYVGRLDINSEGLLLLTNDGDLSNFLSHPSRNFTRKYKVRAFGNIQQSKLDNLAYGVTIDNIKYKPIVANIIKKQGANIWLEFELHEGKNREIRKVCEYLGMRVNRLIRLSFGDFLLDNLEPHQVIELDYSKVKK